MTKILLVEDALAAIQKTEFHLAILDMQLPDGTGFDVSDQLKETATSVIFLTVVDDEKKTYPVKPKFKNKNKHHNPGRK